MPRKKKKVKKDLPPYVVEKRDEWHVKIYEPTKELYASGQKRYLQFTRKCEPKTAERAEAIVKFLKKEIANAKINPANVSTVGELLKRFVSAKTPAIAPATAAS